MSLLDKMPMEELFAYNPSKAADSTSMINQAERECVRAIVEQELSLHLDKVKIPNELLPLFNDAWTEVLAEIYLEDGFGSIRWILAMEITDELLWTLQPKSNMSERTKMIGMLPTLVKVLRQGLNSVNWDRQSADNMFNSLSQYHMTLLRGGSENRVKVAPKPRPVPAPVASVKETVVKPSHDIELLDGLDDDALPLEANHRGEKGWFFRPDTNEWVYQGDEGVEHVAGSSSNNAVRKIGRGDH